jgi:hypothetical protein
MPLGFVFFARCKVHPRLWHGLPMMRFGQGNVSRPSPVPGNVTMLNHWNCGRQGRDRNEAVDPAFGARSEAKEDKPIVVTGHRSGFSLARYPNPSH